MKSAAETYGQEMRDLRGSSTPMQESRVINEALMEGAAAFTNYSDYHLAAVLICVL